MEIPGPGVDAQGRPVVDPTRNVLDLVAAAIQRQDDLREAEARHVRQVMELRADHEAELRRLERQRVDSIRTVDIGEARSSRHAGSTNLIMALAVAVAAMSLVASIVAIVTR